MFAMGGNGRSRFIVPIIIVVWFGIMFTLMFWPMTHMQIDGLPFAIVSLDEGAQTPAGEMNVGDTLVESLTSGGDEASEDEDEDSSSEMIAWTQLYSQEELDEALNNVEYYGALVIPEDYTAATMAAQTAASGSTDTSQSGMDESQLEALAAQSGMDVSQLQALIAQAGEGDMDESQLEALAAQSGMDVSQLQALIAQSGAGEAQSGADASQMQGGGVELSADDMAALQASGVDVLTILDENGELSAEGIAALQASGVDVSTILGEGSDLSVEDMTTLPSASEEEQSVTSAVESDVAETPKLTMIIDNAKSPMVANMLSSSIASMFSEMGAEVDVQVIHNGSEETEESVETEDAEDTIGTGFSMAGMYGTMMGQQLGIMPVCMITMISSMMIARAFRRKDAKTKGGSWSAMLKQALYALCLSFLISILALIMVRGVAGVEIPLVTGGLFIWIAAFCMMLLYLALNNIAGWLGMIGGFCISMLGMMTGIFPAEMLPQFWQDWIYPWTPQHFVGGGLRLIEYVDGGAWNKYTLPMIVYGIVGVVLMIIVGLIPTKAQREHNLEVQGEASGVMETEGVTDTVQEDAASVANKAQEEANAAVQEGRDAAERGKGRHEV